MYINTQTMEVYESQQAIRNAFPNTSFPINITNEILESFSIKPVVEVPPVFNELIETAIPDTPVEVNGVWTQTWKIELRYSTEEERQAALEKHFNYLKKLKIDEINAARLESNTSTFIHLGKEIDCDQLSRGDIETTNGMIANAGALPEDWIGFWKTADNDFLPITTVEEWKAFYNSMFAKGMNNFKHSQLLKMQVNALTYNGDYDSLVAQLNAIVW